MSYSENNTYEKILNRLLANPLLEGVDKRQGSIIYDALAPAAMELSDVYVSLDILEEQTYLLTAVGEKLDLKVVDYGQKRRAATQAKRIVKFYDKDGILMQIDKGKRFAVPADKLEISFIYTGKEDGHDILLCEQFGTKGNEYIGTVLPLESINGLAKAEITSTYIPAQNAETDEEVRKRTIEIINEKAFGGNIQDYINKLIAVDGVGTGKVFPAWEFNGSVLLSVVNASYEPITPEFIKYLKDSIDPEERTGEGVGTAPIGHYVTVSTPVYVDITVEATIEPEAGYTVDQLKELVENQIKAYFTSVRRQFDQDSVLGIYRSRIVDFILNVPQVINVPLEYVLINNGKNDIIMPDKPFLGQQYLPRVTRITLHG